MSETVPRSAVRNCRDGSLICGVTSTNTARRQRSGRCAARRIVVAPPSDMPMTQRAVGATASRTVATASAFCQGP